MLVVVGGHSRNIGKTTAMEAILRDCPIPWWAFKITQHGHGICSEAGLPCGCASGMKHPFAIDEQQIVDATDTGRYLGAGARRAWWVRTAQGELAYALPELRRLLAEAPNALVESNSILNFLVPDLYVAVVDFGVADFKASARRFLSRADALVVTGQGDGWAEVPGEWLEKPRLAIDTVGGFVHAHAIGRLNASHS